MNGWNLNIADIKSIQTPLSILDTLCGELSRITDGRIIARVTEYTPAEGEDEDDSHFTYQMYVTSVRTPRYKYWMFYFSYDIMLYPVSIKMRSDIAEEIGFFSGGPSFNHYPDVSCKDEEEFRATVEKIISSKTMGTVLNNLAALNGLNSVKEEDLPL